MRGFRGPRIRDRLDSEPRRQQRAAEIDEAGTDIEAGHDGAIVPAKR
jgi:hypothetical protein